MSFRIQGPNVECRWSVDFSSSASSGKRFLKSFPWKVVFNLVIVAAVTALWV